MYTTVTRKVQQAAQEAVRNNVMDYDMRHGYRGPSNVLWKVGESAWDSKKIISTLRALPTYGPLLPAVVTQADPQEAVASVAPCRVSERYGRAQRIPSMRRETDVPSASVATAS